MRAFLFFSFLALCLTSPAFGADDYPPGPDSKPQDGVPKGEVTKYTFAHSKIFPGTVRDYWVYVPKQYDAANPACLMVFQDGIQYQAPVVFDNLIAKKEMPVTIGVFIMHGRVLADSTNALDRFNRSYEYDGLGDNYVRFLMDELLPAVTKKYNISTNGNDHAIAGASSGAICAFTAAWERPQQFSRVFSSIGTYVGLRGGNEYPTLIRKTEPKPIRIFLQDGSNDLNIYGGNWHLANLEMLSALEFSGYEVNHIWGDGSHNGKHATAIFPDAMRWLWKDYPAAITAGKDSKQPLMDILIPGEQWQLICSGYKFTEGPAANIKGEVFFTDIPNNRIHKIGLDGKVSVFAENTFAANGLMFGPDGKLYACQNGKKRIVSYDENAKETVIAEDADSNDIAVNSKGEIYFTDPPHHKVWFINSKGEKRVVDEGITKPNGVRFTPDQSLLLVADTDGEFVYSFHIQSDGSLVDKQKYFYLHTPNGTSQSGADGMTVDTQGRLYVATEMGVQVCDQAGRVNGIISKPQRAWLSNVVLGGSNFDDLYVTCGDKVYKRKTKAKGVLSSQTPIKPPTPHL
ncbi:SMP-30/gluconolactonase/LRE family protein [Pedosphaera parvula]|nr:SMP-30/gluconolactonase/LRE family protein [Pedosphaera parvula]